MCPKNPHHTHVHPSDIPSEILTELSTSYSNFFLSKPIPHHQIKELLVKVIHFLKKNKIDEALHSHILKTLINSKNLSKFIEEMPKDQNIDTLFEFDYRNLSKITCYEWIHDHHKKAPLLLTALSQILKDNRMSLNEIEPPYFSALAHALRAHDWSTVNFMIYQAHLYSLNDLDTDASKHFLEYLDSIDLKEQKPY